MKTFLRISSGQIVLGLAFICGLHDPAVAQEIKSISPNTSVRGRILRIQVEGTGLDSKKLTIPTPGSKIATGAALTAVVAGKIWETQITIALDAPVGEHAVCLESNLVSTACLNAKIRFFVVPTIDAEYVDCPTAVAAVSSPNPEIDITCTQSLLDWKEASDIFGKRIAGMYLIAEVKIRNLSDDHEFLLHDVRLNYGGLGVTGRDRYLVRGVAEKGQVLDARNFVMRGVVSAGTILAGIATMPIADEVFKDSVNLLQGPFVRALDHFIPDLTIAQMNRLNDKAFGVQAMVVPKRSSVDVVSFLSQRVFLTPKEQQEFRCSRSKLTWKSKCGQEISLLKFQQNLGVQVAGAHVTEVRLDRPTLQLIDPARASINRNASARLRLVGTNLDRVAKIRLRNSTGSFVEGSLSGIQTDGKVAIAEVSLNDKSPAGNYEVLLVTTRAQEELTSLSFGVEDAGPAMPRVNDAYDVDGNRLFPKGKAGASTVLRVTFEGENLDQVKEIRAVTGIDDELDKEITVGLTDSKLSGDKKKLDAKVTITEKAVAGLHAWRIVPQTSDATSSQARFKVQ